MRLRIYNKMTTHPEILSDLERLNQILAEQEKSYIHNEILDLNNNEEKLLPVLEEFERVVRTADGEEELNALDEQVQKLQVELEENIFNSKESPKRKYQSKEENEVFERILNYVYTELSEEYDKKAYNLPAQKDVADQKLDEASLSEPKGSENGLANPESIELEPSSGQKQIDLRTKVWTDLETTRLLKGIHQYRKLSGQMFSKLENSNSALPSSYQSNGWGSGANTKNCYASFNSRIAKSKKKLTGLIEDIGGNIVAVPLEHPDKSNGYYDEDGEDPEMRHYI